ncbi:hypothetical protein [Nocardioides pocheonensis]|uniref:Nuclear transport factor 2 family protein n=1 Tax=Nocardioides pocheonensis TaxID=661485 RepID=A0A3N0GS16_9ACTN|nr:hypothetical protein [Nocardioides pocheonensis]RNM14968.1 hypothetical protein EFL26_09640 [Nocardioides pocheonensis]
MRSSTRARATALCGILAALALLASACGGSDAQSSDGPSTTVSTSAAPTPTPSPTATPSEEPLSAFEGRPQVQALRAYFAAVGQAVNAGDRTLGTVAPLATAAGLESTRGAVKGDLEHGYHWPGPEPFTPTAVRSSRGSATVSTCMLSTGWSVDAKTGKTVGGRKARSVKPILVDLKKVAGTWKVDAILLGTGDCASVTIKEVRW